MGRSKAYRRKNRYRSCICKVRYWTQKGATVARDKMQAKSAQPRPLDVYECQHCKGWHIGMKLPNSGNDRRKRKKARERVAQQSGE